MSEVTKIKKNYKLLGTESDPVIIAQRLLNLYRQLHIFSQEKKEAYNQMLLEQTPEVKRTLGNLPGGIVLQQYIADIEEEAGLEVEDFSMFNSVPQENSQENLNAKTPKVSAISITVINRNRWEIVFLNSVNNCVMIFFLHQNFIYFQDKMSAKFTSYAVKISIRRLVAL